MSSHAAIRHLKAARLWRADGWQADAGLALDADGCLPGSVGEDIFCSLRGILPGSDFFVQRVDDDHIRLR